MTRTLLGGTALALITLAAPQARACELSGFTYTCTITEAAPIVDDRDNVDVTVQSGARVDNADGIAIELSGDDGEITNDGEITSAGVDGDGDGFNAIELDDDHVIANNGIIASADGRAIDADDDLSVTNTGDITAQVGDAINASDDLSVVNSGRIESGDDGVQGDSGTVENAAGGTITAADKAVTFDGDATVTNDGTITAGDEGVEAGDATVTNTGRITAVEDAVQVATGDITNAGTIESTDPSGGGDGLDIDDGSVVNSGTISAIDGAGIDVDGPVADAGETNPNDIGDLTVENSDTIRGLIGIQVETESFTEDDEEFFPNASAQIITNSGIIEGTDGTAMLLGAGEDVLTLLDGAQVIGETLFGEDNDLLAFDATVDGYDSLFDGGAGTDRVEFAFDLSFLRTSTEIAPNTVSLGFSGTDVDFDVTLANFESFHIGGEDFTFDEVVEAVPAIPLPAGIWLLGGGLAGLAWLRRRAA